MTTHVMSLSWLLCSLECAFCFLLQLSAQCSRARDAMCSACIVLCAHMASCFYKKKKSTPSSTFLDAP